MRALGIMGVATLSLLSPPAAAQPDDGPRPAVPITSHDMTVDDYPEESIRLQEQGEVRVRFLISETGDVTQCNVARSSGHMHLDEAACSLVRRWKYSPATQAGKATTQTTTANMVFRLVSGVGVGSVEDLLNFPDMAIGAMLPPPPSGSSDPAMDVPSSYVRPSPRNQ